MKRPNRSRKDMKCIPFGTKLEQMHGFMSLMALVKTGQQREIRAHPITLYVQKRQYKYPFFIPIMYERVNF